VLDLVQEGLQLDQPRVRLLQLPLVLLVLVLLQQQTQLLLFQYYYFMFLILSFCLYLRENLLHALEERQQLLRILVHLILFLVDDVVDDLGEYPLGLLLGAVAHRVDELSLQLLIVRAAVLHQLVMAQQRLQVDLPRVSTLFIGFAHVLNNVVLGYFRSRGLVMATSSAFL